ncbi:hypothetical protein GIB67_014564, partial [Kingdonia uniflora]
ISINVNHTRGEPVLFNNIIKVLEVEVLEAIQSYSGRARLHIQTQRSSSALDTT